jgi:beta-phosphoglucomutase-like phosphatase (HAD superfamily)
VDSEPLSMRVLLETVAEAGAIINAKQGYELFLGKSLASVIQILRRDYGVAVSDDALSAMRQKLYALFKAELRPIGDIADALQERLRRNLSSGGVEAQVSPHRRGASSQAQCVPPSRKLADLRYPVSRSSVRRIGQESRQCPIRPRDP